MSARTVTMILRNDDVYLEGRSGGIGRGHYYRVNFFFKLTRADEHGVTDWEAKIEVRLGLVDFRSEAWAKASERNGAYADLLLYHLLKQAIERGGMQIPEPEEELVLELKRGTVPPLVNEIPGFGAIKGTSPAEAEEGR